MMTSSAYLHRKDEHLVLFILIGFYTDEGCVVVLCTPHEAGPHNRFSLVGRYFLQTHPTPILSICIFVQLVALDS